MVSEMADKGSVASDGDLRQGSMHQRRGRQGVSRDQHDDHLECEGKEREDAGVPGAGNRGYGGVRDHVRASMAPANVSSTAKT